MKKINLYMSIVLSALAIFVMIEAKKMPAEMPGSGLGPGAMPFWLGVGILVLSIILAIESLLDKKAAKAIFNIGESKSVILMFLALVLYVICVDLLGFGISTLFLVLFMVRRLGKYAWWKCGAMGIAVAVVSVYLFRVLLDMPLPKGLTGF